MAPFPVSTTTAIVVVTITTLLLLLPKAAAASAVGAPSRPPVRNRTQIIEECFSILETHWVVGHRCWNATQYNFPWSGKCDHYHFFRPSAPGKHGKYESAQWLWDSALASVVISHHNVTKSIFNLRSLLSKQFNAIRGESNFEGMVPEMIFWPEQKLDQIVVNDLEYGWQSDVTMITQMPVVSFNLESIWLQTHDKDLVREFLPALVKYHRWWKTREEQNTSGGSCPSHLHGWETGMDASPAYDEAYFTPPNTTQNKMYPHFLSLMFGYTVDYDWNMTDILGRDHAKEKHPGALEKFLMDDAWFYVQDVGLCGVLADGWGVLADLAAAIGDNTTEVECRREEMRLSEIISRKHWNNNTGRFHSRYRRPDGSWHFAAANTLQNVFGPLLASNLPEWQLQAVINHQMLNPKKYDLPFTFPTTAADDPAFNASYSEQDDLMWRGPAWGATNWFTIRGIAKHNATIERLRSNHSAAGDVEGGGNIGGSSVLEMALDKWVALVNQAAAFSPPKYGKLGQTGIWEQYNPISGAGEGVPGLGMSTLIADALIRFG